MIVLISLVSPPGVSAGEPLFINLMSCYREAVAHSEAVAISEEDIARARAEAGKVLGGFLPIVSASGSEFLQDPESNSGGGSSVSSTYTRFSRPEAVVSVSQQLFQGLKEFHTFKAAGVRAREAEYRRDHAKRLLFQDLAAVFVATARLDRMVTRTADMIRVLREESRDTETRAALGKVRESELASRASELATLEAELETVKGEREVARSALAFLVGIDPVPPLALDPLPGEPAALDHYLSSGLDRPDRRSAALQLELAELETHFRKGDLLPRADVAFNYYPYRVGFQSDIDWDTLFTLSVPLFDWQTVSSFKEARAKERQARYGESVKKRGIETDIKKAYADYQATRRGWVRYREAAWAQEKAYRLHREDYRLGIISYIELLRVERDWLDAVRTSDNAEFAMRLKWTTLRFVAGELP